MTGNPANKWLRWLTFNQLGSPPMVKRVRREKLTYLSTAALCDLHDLARGACEQGVGGCIIEAGCALGRRRLLRRPGIGVPLRAACTAPHREAVTRSKPPPCRDWIPRVAMDVPASPKPTGAEGTERAATPPRCGIPGRGNWKSTSLSERGGYVAGSIPARSDPQARRKYQSLNHRRSR